MIFKNTFQLNFKKLINVYTIINRKLLRKKIKINFFSIFLKKKLTYYHFIFPKKKYTYSNGQLLKNKIQKIKFFKKSQKCFGLCINILYKKSHKLLKSISVFYCKNFNYKNYIWIKKFFTLIKPSIDYFITSQSWNFIMKKKKRIKKKIYRNLIKQSKLV